MPRKDNYTVCPCCDEEKVLTRHHIYPRRVFGRQNNNDVFLLCRTCHDELERHIPYEPMPIGFYERILKQFVEEFCISARRQRYD